MPNLKNGRVTDINMKIPGNGNQINPHMIIINLKHGKGMDTIIIPHEDGTMITTTIKNPNYGEEDIIIII